MNWKDKVKRLGIISVILIHGTSCAVLPEIATTSISAVSGYYSYKAATADKIEVTTISKDCFLYQYQSIPDPEWESLSDATKRAIAGNNKAMVENCDNIEKPE